MPFYKEYVFCFGRYFEGLSQWQQNSIYQVYNNLNFILTRNNFKRFTFIFNLHKLDINVAYA